MSHSDGELFKAALARATFAKMALADLVQVSGFGSSLQAAMYSMIGSTLISTRVKKLLKEKSRKHGEPQRDGYREDQSISVPRQSSSDPTTA